MIVVAILEQKVITPYRQIEDYSTYPFIYATLLSSNQILTLNNELGRYEIRTLSVVGHTHSNYALTEHTHSNYALTEHTHSNYALTEHTHSEYALTEHTHSNYALTEHTHSWNTISYTPTTLSGYGITDAYTKDEVDDMFSGITLDAYTKTEIQNFFSGLSLISGYNKDNWDTSFGWGDPHGVFLPLTGGTVTGKITGTEAEFTTSIKTESFILNSRTLTIRTL